MNIQALPETTSVRAAVSRDEWEVRVELAAAHRLMAHFGIQDLTHNHLTARVPGEPGHFLISRKWAFTGGGPFEKVPGLFRGSRFKMAADYLGRAPGASL